MSGTVILELYVGISHRPTVRCLSQFIWVFYKSPEHLQCINKTSAQITGFELFYARKHVYIVIFIVRMSGYASSSSIVRRISHRPTVRVIHLFEYHLSRTSSCIKNTSDANHRLSFSILLCSLSAIFSLSPYVCTGHPQLYVGFLTDQLSVSSIYLKYHLSRTSSCIKRLPRKSPASFSIFLFCYIHCPYVCTVILNCT